MNSFCPLIKDACKGKECVMWKTQQCLIVNFVENYVEHSKVERGYRSSLGPIDHSFESEVPEKIKKATPEKLADEMLAFAKREFPDEWAEPTYFTTTISDLFWKSQGIDNDMIFSGVIPAEFEIKMERAMKQAYDQIENEREPIIREKLKKEKAELPSQVKVFADWASDHGLKNVIIADVDTFLLENDIKISPETKRSLRMFTNTELRSRG